MIKLICILLSISYIVWQYKVISKYAFKFDKFALDIKNKFVIINGRIIKFQDIHFVSVDELEQPSILERSLTRSRCNYMADMVFHLKNDTTQKCTFNFKGLLYKNLKQLQQYIKVDADIEEYKQEGLPNWLVLLLLIIGGVWIIVTLYRGI